MQDRHETCSIGTKQRYLESSYAPARKTCNTSTRVWMYRYMCIHIVEWETSILNGYHMLNFVQENFLFHSISACYIYHMLKIVVRGIFCTKKNYVFAETYSRAKICQNKILTVQIFSDPGILPCKSNSWGQIFTTLKVAWCRAGGRGEHLCIPLCSC